MTNNINWLLNIISVIIGALISGLTSWFEKKYENNLEAKIRSKEDQREWLRNLLNLVNNIDYSLYKLRVLYFENNYYNTNKDINKISIADSIVDLSLYFKKLQYKLNSLKFEFINKGYFSEKSDLDISDEINIPFYVDPSRENYSEVKEKENKKLNSEKKNEEILKILKIKNNNNGKEKILIDLINLIYMNLMSYSEKKDSKTSKYMDSVTSRRNMRTIDHYMEELKNGIELYVYVDLNKLKTSNY